MDHYFAFNKHACDAVVYCTISNCLVIAGKCDAAKSGCLRHHVRRRCARCVDARDIDRYTYTQYRMHAVLRLNNQFLTVTS